jgi:predicted DNA-binding transcriptional regulator YafY
VGKKEKNAPILTLALDRIQTIKLDLKTDYLHEAFDGDAYYKNTFGVTVLSEIHLKEIVLKIDRYNAPYVLTKPFHHSQELLEKLPNGSIIIKIQLHINFELERLILGFGNAIEVLQPKVLRDRIQWKLEQALRSYNELKNDKESF